MGRWTGYTFRLGLDCKLNVITAYRIINQPITSSNTMATNSQQNELLQKRRITTKPRKQFIQDFCDQFKEMCNLENEYTLVMLDANESFNQPEIGSITELIIECGLIDIYQTYHQDTSDFPTHTNGSRVLDYILGSANILQFVEKVGYIKFHVCFDSNHQGIYCDLSKTILQQQNKNEPQRQRLVGTNSTNYEGELYARHLHQHSHNNNIFNKSHQLLEDIKEGRCDNETAIKQINVMDEIVTTAMLRSEVINCKKKDPSLWTPAIK
jgi:hypothetical protein